MSKQILALLAQKGETLIGHDGRHWTITDVCGKRLPYDGEPIEYVYLHLYYRKSKRSNPITLVTRYDVLEFVTLL